MLTLKIVLGFQDSNTKKENVEEDITKGLNLRMTMPRSWIMIIPWHVCQDHTYLHMVIYIVDNEVKFG